MGSITGARSEAYLYKYAHSNESYLSVEAASGLYLRLSDGRNILDATGGAAVSAIGHGNERVQRAVAAQFEQVEYCYPGFFKTACAQQLADHLVRSTNGKMARACFLGSGSEAMEAAMKLARQYFLGLSAETARYRFIAREGSWHGATISTLAAGDFKARKWPFEVLASDNISRVSACNPYRGMKSGETPTDYVSRLAQELEDEFQRVGPDTVCAFLAEPMVGTTLGCVTAVPGYFQAIREVCDRHGALLIFDEVMCGMGRTGTLHAWEQENVIPDIQAIGKALGAGYAPISALLVNERVIAGLKRGGGFFYHGQTYQSYPASCAAALEVQKIIEEESLLANVRCMGHYLGHLLHDRLDKHPHVGDIRGRGLFWAIEFVADRVSKKPLDSRLNVAKRLGQTGLEEGHDISLFTASGSADGWHGDHFLLAPPYTISSTDVEEIVKRVCRVIEAVFDDLGGKRKLANGYSEANGCGRVEGVDGVGH